MNQTSAAQKSSTITNFPDKFAVDNGFRSGLRMLLPYLGKDKKVNIRIDGTSIKPCFRKVNGMCKIYYAICVANVPESELLFTGTKLPHFTLFCGREMSVGDEVDMEGLSEEEIFDLLQQNNFNRVYFDAIPKRINELFEEFIEAKGPIKEFALRTPDGLPDNIMNRRLHVYSKISLCIRYIRENCYADLALWLEDFDRLSGPHITLGHPGTRMLSAERDLNVMIVEKYNKRPPPPVARGTGGKGVLINF